MATPKREEDRQHGVERHRIAGRPAANSRAPAVKIAIQAVTQAGTTTRPSAAMPRPAMSVAATAWLCGPIERES